VKDVMKERKYNQGYLATCKVLEIEV